MTHPKMSNTNPGWKRPEVSGGIETGHIHPFQALRQYVGKDLKSAVGLRLHK